MRGRNLRQAETQPVISIAWAHCCHFRCHGGKETYE